MKLKKLTALLLALVMFVSLGVGVLAEDELVITTDKRLPKATLNEEYHTFIQATGGDGNYTFTLENPTSVPPNLRLEPNGELWGTPEQGGTTFSDIVVIVTDGANNTARKQFELPVEAINVKFEVGQNRFVFDNEEHVALDIVPYVNKQRADFIEFTVTYGGEQSQKNVGMYLMKIEVTTPGYVFYSTDKSRLYIDQNDNVDISYIGNSFPYDEQPHSPQVFAVGRYTEESEWFDLPHEETYEGIDVDYPLSSTPPTLPGSYRMTCTISNPNFSTPYEMSSTTFEITRSDLNFTLDDRTPFRRGDEWNRSYKPSIDSIPETDYEVKYIKDGTEYSAPQDIGTYDVEIVLKGDTAVQYSIGTINPSTIEVGKELVEVAVSDATKPYAINPQSPTITKSKDIGLVVSYTDSNGNPVTSGEPVNAGTYTMTIVPENPDEYELRITSPTTFTITPIEVTFKTDKTSYKYDEEAPPTPIITTTPNISSELYEVKYKERGTEGEPSTGINDIGTYDVIIELKDTVNYIVSDDSTHVISVAETPVNFTVKNLSQQYDGNPKHVTIETDNNEHCYSVEYKQGGKLVTEPTTAGTYTVVIVPHEGYGIEKIYLENSETPEVNPIKLVITKKPVTFTATNIKQKYTGSGITATVTTEDDIPTSAYTVTYRKQGTSEAATASVRDIGVYDIIVTITDNNYETSFTGTLTITENIKMNYGNSPVGMIYRDPNHQDDTEWRNAARNNLIANNHFVEGYVPDKCSKDILYPYLSHHDHVELMEMTVIVKDIKDFAAADPGIVVNGQTVHAIMQPVQSNIPDGDGIYEVTYTKDDGTAYQYEDEDGNKLTCKRYIMVIGKIGDVNADNTVNATDANVLDHLTDNTPRTLTQMRVWDVNKDGLINKDDASAIRNRFKTKLVPYYPWV